MNNLEKELLELGGGDITTALDEMLLPAALLDADGVIRWQNRAASALRGERVGFEFSEFVASDERAETRAIIDGIVREAAPAEFVVHVRDRTGTYGRVEASAVPVRGASTIVGVFGLGRTANAAASPQPLAGIDLTRRQREVLRLLADGRSTDEIASHLSLSPTTVRNHVANIMAALGVHSRLQAVVAAIKNGLLDEDPGRIDTEFRD